MRLRLGWALVALLAPSMAALVTLATPMPLRASEQACSDDPALAEAALGLLVASEGLPSPEALMDAARAAGAQAPSLRARLFRADADTEVQAWLRSLSADAPIACGEADDGVRRLVVAGELGGSLELLGDPARALRVRLAAGLSEPRVVLEDAEGRLTRLPVEGPTVALPSELTPPFVAQLIATGAHGPRPVARAHFGEVALASGARGDDLTAGVRALRDAAGASALRPNRLLDAGAQEHAARVCALGRAAHSLGDGDPEQRLRQRGLVARVVGETVARAPSVAGALDSLAASPSHRMTLVDPRFTDVGYGVAADAEGARCVVVLLAAWPRPVPRGLRD